MIYRSVEATAAVKSVSAATAGKGAVKPASYAVGSACKALRETVYAAVASKRTSIIYLSETDRHHTSRNYYVSFEVANGDQMEFRVSGPEYRMMTEGNEGMLSFQGTRYLEFEIKK